MINTKNGPGMSARLQPLSRDLILKVNKNGDEKMQKVPSYLHITKRGVS